MVKNILGGGCIMIGVFIGLVMITALKDGKGDLSDSAYGIALLLTFSCSAWCTASGIVLLGAAEDEERRVP